MSFWPSPLYVTKKDERVIIITGAKYRARVEETLIAAGKAYQDDAAGLLNGTALEVATVLATGSALSFYVGDVRAFDKDAVVSATPAAYASDKISHTLRQWVVTRSMYVWYDSPPLVRADVATTSGSVSLTMGSTVGLIVGMTVAGTGIPTGSTIVSINANGTTFVISQPCTASATVSGTFTGNIVGECAIIDYDDASGSLPVYPA
jgi:hypothetical protein